MRKNLVLTILVFLLLTLAPVAAQEGGSRDVITPENAAQLSQVAVWGYGEIYGVAYSPDGALLAISSATGVRLLDGTTLASRYFFELLPESKVLLRWAGTDLYIGTPNGTIFEWQRDATELTTVVDYGPSGQLIDFVPTQAGSKIAILLDSVTLEVYDSGSAQSEVYFTAQSTSVILAFAWSPDGNTLAISTDDGILYLNDEPVLTGLNPAIERILWSPDGTQLVAIGSRLRRGAPARFYDLVSKTITQEMDLPRTAEASLTWVTGLESAKLVYASGTGEITDLFSNEAITLSEPPMVGFRSVTFSADGLRVAALDAEIAKIYDLTTGSLIGNIGGIQPIESILWQGQRVLYGHFSPLYRPPQMTIGEAGQETFFMLGGARFPLPSPILDRVVMIQSSSGPNPVHILNLTTMTEIEVASAVAYGGVAWSADGHRLLLALFLEDHSGQVLEIVDPTSGQVVKTLAGTMNRVMNLRWSPDGTRVSATDAFDVNAVIWDTTTGERVADIPEAHVLGWSLDGQFVAIQKGTIGIWDALSFQPLVDLGITSNGAVNPLVAQPVWSPDGTRFAVISTDNELMVWDSTTAEARSIDYAQEIGLTWSPDGRLLAGFDRMNALTLWDVSSGAVLHTIPERDGYQFSTVTFSSDGTLLTAGTMEGAVLVFGIP